MEAITPDERWRLRILFLLITVHIEGVSSTNGHREFCYKGRYLATPTAAGEPKYCMSCAPGTFIPDELHNYTKCFPCTRVQHPELERLITPCNKSHDTVIHCIGGYYWPISPWPDKRATCMKCKNCSVTQSPCQKFQNTECCPGNNYEVRLNKSGQPICLHICGLGQFLDEAEDRCAPCLNNTFMDEARHTNQYCKTCAVPSSPHEKVVRLCTSSQSSIIGCEDGFYRRRSDDSLADVCAPCSNCFINTNGNVYEGRPCGEWKNTVCCPQPNMTVIDISGAQQCLRKVCTEGESLSEDLTSCQPCPAGTFLNETRHVRHHCLSCRKHPVARHCLESRAESTDDITCGGIVAIVTTSFALIALSAIAVFCYRRRRSSRGSAAHPESGDNTRSNMPDQDDDRTRLLGNTGHHPDPHLLRSDLSGKIKSVAPERKLLNNFMKENLPEDYCDDLVFDMIKVLADLTVYLVVPKSSEKRCKKSREGGGKDYPYSKNPEKQHTGCGWVERVRHLEKDFEQTEIVVCTAARVVFDMEEGSQTKCYFNDKRQIIDGAKKVLSNAEKDWCYMVFVTNDHELRDRLKEQCEKLNKFRCDALFKFHIVPDPFCESSNLFDKVKQLENRYQEWYELLQTLFRSITNISERPSETTRSHSVTDFGTRLNLERLELCDLFANEENVVDQNQRILKMIKESEILKRCKKTLDEMNKFLEEEGKGARSSEMSDAKYKQWCLEAAALTRLLHLFKSVFVHHWEHANTHKYPKYEYRFNHIHPFTIITTLKCDDDMESWTQNVSLGQVTLRKSMWFDHHSIYCYSNITGDGDEGAPVLVIGNMGFHCHGHSGRLGNVSESGAWSDIIPDIADLSAHIDDTRT